MSAGFGGDTGDPRQRNRPPRESAFNGVADFRGENAEHLRTDLRRQNNQVAAGFRTMAQDRAARWRVFAVTPWRGGPFRAEHDDALLVKAGSSDVPIMLPKSSGGSPGEAVSDPVSGRLAPDGAGRCVLVICASPTSGNAVVLPNGRELLNGARVADTFNTGSRTYMDDGNGGWWTVAST